MKYEKRFSALFLASLLVTGCRDTLGPNQTPVPATEPPVKTNILARFDCVVDVSARETSCAVPVPSRTPGGPARAILGTPYVKLRSFNVSYDSVTSVFKADINVQNLLPEVMGTPDGTTVTGTKVFYESGPSVTGYVNPGDTGTVTVRNADGVATFTHPNQPFYLYNQILAPNETSPLKNWQWNIPRTVKTFAFVLLLSADLPSEARIPEFSPESIPSWFYSPDSLLTDTTYATGHYVRNVVKVWFSPLTRQPRRREIIDSIGGVVVGGSRLGGKDGYYFVQVPGDSTGVGPYNAANRLQRFTEVLDASRFWINIYSVQSVQPNDGANFQNWRLSADSADGQNWAPEAIAAPLAWGCSRGDTSVAVADVDSDFHPIAELTANAHPSLADPHFGALNTVNDTADHGTKTAAIIAAAGNNAAGITGLMWTARLRMYEAAVDPSTGNIAPYVGAANQPDVGMGLAAQILRAARDGAAVINLSFGLDWDVLVSPGYHPHLNSPDTVVVHDVTRGINAVIRILDGEGLRPLFVIAAGNNNLDAYWAGMPNAALTWPNRVLVVGAIRQGMLAPNQFRKAGFSNFGGIVPVNLYAPGENVYTLNRSGNPRPASGTSFAAPHVTGVAGMLLSFDPRLTTDSLRSFLMRGATRGRRTAVGVPVLNAYESLKLAAEKRGAPLCGNPVYQDSLKRVFVRRDSLWTFAELVGTMNDSLLAPLHGGRRVRFASGNGFQWQQTGATAMWVSATGLADTIANATNRSKLGQSHNADSTVTVAKTRISTTQERFTVSVNGAQIGVVDGPLAQAAQGKLRRCIKWPLTDTEANCSIFATEYRDSLVTSFTAAYSPTGDTIVLAIARDSFAFDISSQTENDIDFYYRPNGPITLALPTQLYFIPIRGGAVRGPVTYQNRVERLGLSEDGQYLVLQTRAFFSKSTFTLSGLIINKYNSCLAGYFKTDGSWSFSLPALSYQQFDRTACYPETTYAP